MNTEKKKKPVKGYFINSQAETVEEVMVDMNYVDGDTDVHRLIGCRVFTISYWDGDDETSDVIFVDDEGLLTLTPESKFFYFAGANTAFAGSGVILGTDEEGNSVDVKLPIEEFKKVLTFHTLNEARLMFRHIKEYSAGV